MDVGAEELAEVLQDDPGEILVWTLKESDYGLGVEEGREVGEKLVLMTLKNEDEKAGESFSPLLRSGGGLAVVDEEEEGLTADLVRMKVEPVNDRRMFRCVGQSVNC